MHVAGERHDRRRRLAALARADRPEQVPVRRANESWKAAQCSMSTAWRIFSAIPARGAAPGAARHRLAPGLAEVHPAPEQPRQRGAHQQVVEAARGVLVHPVPLLLVEHRALALLEHPPGARVDHDQARAPEVAAVAPAGTVGLAVGAEREVLEQLLGVVARLHLRQQLVVPMGVRGEVAEVLVDPVRRQRPHDVLVPPLVLARLLDPRLGDVPVVVHVVVVEDHHRRDGGEQPADRQGSLQLSR